MIKKIIQKEIGTILCDYFYSTLNESFKDNKSLKFEDLEKFFSKSFDKNINFFDSLFFVDNHQLPLIYYIGLEKPDFINIIFTKYEEDLKKINPSIWSFIFFDEKSKLRTKVYNFYSKDYIEEIKNNLNHNDIICFDIKNLDKLFIEKKLNNFIETYSIKDLFSHPDLNPSHIGLIFQFYLHKKEEYIQYFENKLNDIQNIAFLPIFKNDILLNEITSVNFPDKNILETYVFNKANNENDLLDFLSFNQKILEDNKINNKYKITFNLDENIIFEYINNHNFDNKKTIRLLMPYLLKKPEILSFYIITNVISKEDLFININNLELRNSAQYHILKESIPTTNMKKKNNKI